MSTQPTKPNSELLEYLDVLLLSDSPEQISEIAESPDLIEELELHEQTQDSADEEIEE